MALSVAPGHAMLIPSLGASWSHSPPDAVASSLADAQRKKWHLSWAPLAHWIRGDATPFIWGRWPGCFFWWTLKKETILGRARNLFYLPQYESFMRLGVLLGNCRMAGFAPGTRSELAVDSWTPKLSCPAPQLAHVGQPALQPEHGFFLSLSGGRAWAGLLFSSRMGQYANSVLLGNSRVQLM